MKNNKKTKKVIINDEKIVTVIFIVTIFSSLIFSIIKGYDEIKAQILQIYQNEEMSKCEKIVELTKQSESIVNDNIIGKENYVNIYGLTQKILGRKYIEDSNDPSRNIVKLKNGMLTFIQKKQDMTSKAEKIINFNKFLQKNEIPFIYVQAPYKVKDEEYLPTGIVDYANQNADELLKELTNGEVQIIDLREKFLTKQLEEEFFTTDHHWKIQTAFEATNYVSEILNQNYKFKIDDYFTNMEHYKIVKMEKRFLGSIGKRIGKYYAGTDEFDYIVPDFDTKLIVSNQREEQKLEGTFEETIINKRFLEENDITANKYACYFGGDYPEIIVQNENSEFSKKILVIQDSYGLPFSAIMSLRVKELRILDLRHFEGSEIDYIKQYQPDAIIMLYNPSSFYIEKIFNFE